MWEQTTHGQISGLRNRNAIDCLLTAIFFCYVGFYNGIGLTKNKEFGCNFGRAFLFLQNGYNFLQWVYAKMELR